MKKTLTVNLGGTVYQIDEDAYTLLDNYLNNLRYHFRKETGADEIVHDMEMRIAELFNGYLQHGQQVITIENVEAVIARVGRPEEIGEDEEATAREESEQHDTQPHKRLFRNPDDRILGGVASGFSAYMGWDPTWVRLAMIVIGIFFKELIVIYLITWIVMPVARTATEKLQMRGEAVTMENIGRTVTDGFGQAATSKPYSVIHQLGNAFVRLIGLLLKVVLVLLAICCVPALFVGMVILFAMLAAATGLIVSVPTFFSEALPWIDWGTVATTPGFTIAMVTCGIFIIGIPITGLIQLLMQSFGKWKPMPTGTKILLTLLWIMALAAAVILLSQMPLLGHPHFYI